MKKVLGVGAALVDLLVSVDDSWIQKLKVEKGGMILVDYEKISELLQTLPAYERVPGGSACNTIVGLSKLGAAASFVAKIGNDSLGELYETHLRTSGVESLLGKTTLPTGCVLSAVTPDAERTMFSFMGASDTLSIQDFSPALFSDVALTYIEGYRAFDHDTFYAILEMSKACGVPTAVDFGSFGVVNVCRALFEKLFAEKKIDIIFANEEEARAYTGLEARAALDELGKLAPIAVVKVGKDGAWISNSGNVIRVEAAPAQSVDTTGAGDLWAAGFLYGYLAGQPLNRAGALASALAAEVVQVTGSQVPDAAYARLKQKML